MRVRGRVTRSAVLAAILGATVLLPAGPTSAADSTWTVTGPQVATVGAVETLGDSVPAGTACGCGPYPAHLGARLRALTGPPMVSYDDAVPGALAADVLHQLRYSSTVRAHVRAAQVVVVEVGANDISYNRTCGTDTDCYGPARRAAGRTLAAVVAAIRALTPAHPPAIVLLGYWDVWLDGKYAAARGTAYVNAGQTLTAQFNAMVRGLAQTTASAYADLWLAFRGTSGADDTRLLAADGDHPNLAGHLVITSAVYRVVVNSLYGKPFPPVSLSSLVPGAVNGDVATYQEALRAYLIRNRALGTLDAEGITGHYDATTSAMTRAAYAVQSRLTGDSTWLSGDLSRPGPGLLTVLRLRLR